VSQAREPDSLSGILVRTLSIPMPLPCGKRQHSKRAILAAPLTRCTSLRRPYHGVQSERGIMNCHRFSDGIQLAFVDTY
jgi:hypothetical protein